jgi:hypothetical protein
MEPVWRLIGAIAVILTVILAVCTIDTIALWWGLRAETTDEWLKRHYKKKQQDAKLAYEQQEVKDLYDNLPRDNNGNLTDQARRILASEFRWNYS